MAAPQSTTLEMVKHIAAQRAMDDVRERMEKRDAKHHTGSTAWLNKFDDKYLPSRLTAGLVF